MQPRFFAQLEGIFAARSQKLLRKLASSACNDQVGMAMLPSKHDRSS